MDKIKITNSLFNEKASFRGVESNVYIIDGLLYKVFKGMNNNTIKNKIEKVEILKDLNINGFDPEGIIYLGDEVVGYAIKYDKDFKEVDTFKTSIKNKIQILKKVKEELEELHKKGIVFGDLTPANILEKDGNIILCDYDNVHVSNYDFDTISLTEKPYINKFGKTDLERLDTYMLNITTMSYLTNVVVSFAVDELYYRGLPSILNTKENKEIADAMICLDDKDKIEPFVDHIKRYHL